VLNSRTKLFGVIGDPVGHSLSPVLQNYFLKKFKINAVYLAFRVLPANLQSCVQGAWAMGFAGLNVTLPHKSDAAQLASFKSPEVNLLGVANTLVMREEGVAAFITDPYGFTESLGNEKNRFEGNQAILFGAGGSARSITFALSRLRVRQITIVNRTSERAIQLEQFCKEQLAFQNVTHIGFDDPALDDRIDEATILVNSTSIGMAPHTDQSPLPSFKAISKKHFVYDLVYNPSWTRFLHESEKRGATVKNGMDMLIFQGLESLRIWMNEQYALERNILNDLRIQLTTELQA
jgi:shikimate dehydrogenase